MFIKIIHVHTSIMMIFRERLMHLSFSFFFFFFFFFLQIDARAVAGHGIMRAALLFISYST